MKLTNLWHPNVNDLIYINLILINLILINLLLITQIFTNPTTNYLTSIKDGHTTDAY